VISNGSVPIFVQLLLSPNDDVREQAVWALGNIAGDSPECRDLVLNHGALLPLLEQLNPASKMSMLRNATWTLSNLCRGKPQPRWDFVAPALPRLAQLIFSNDEEVLADGCWALSYLSDGPNEKIQAVLDTGICPRIVELMGQPHASVQTPALRTAGNIVTGDDTQTQAVINCGVLPKLLKLLSSGKKGIRKEACWTLSNITAGTREQIQAVIEANVVPPLIQLLASAEFDIKKEAAWSISNATSGGTPEQIGTRRAAAAAAARASRCCCARVRALLVCARRVRARTRSGRALAAVCALRRCALSVPCGACLSGLSHALSTTRFNLIDLCPPLNALPSDFPFIPISDIFRPPCMALCSARL
jgi:hypothetical protein